MLDRLSFCGRSIAARGLRLLGCLGLRLFLLLLLDLCLGLLAGCGLGLFLVVYGNLRGNGLGRLFGRFRRSLDRSLGALSFLKSQRILLRIQLVTVAVGLAVVMFLKP